ncbi:helicase-related protein [Calidithermus chliarophilus]|uniref:helicase-related protein n=1 Tax=Calidithermus chliarophilus TaxID=52023 RepID=UPI0004169527|nr:helicase-related protein [Calidithermus chliarophilus]
MRWDSLVDRVLQAPFWPEPVRVLRVAPAGGRYAVVAEGLSSRQTHHRLLGEADVADLLRSGQSEERPFGGDGELFALGVEARRIQLGYAFDPFFAVSASRIDPLPHQLEAVYGVLLKKSRVRFLLADDPGAGKTVMAGLFLKELKYRGVLERALIVTPANLTDQWQRELKEKFGETFEVMNRDSATAAYQDNPWEKRSQLITSIDFAKREENLSLLERVQWDLVIVDESHKLSATRYGAEVKKSQRYRLGEVLARSSTHLLFLTATPHQGDDEKFRLLLDLLEPDLFANTALLQEAARKNENPILLRRLKEDMTDFEGKPLFPPRYVHSLSFKLSPSERELYAKVSDYVGKHFKRAWDERRRNVGLAMTVLQRRLASSTYAIAQSLENRQRRLESLRQQVAALQENPYGEYTEEELEEMAEDERWRVENAIAERLTLARNLPELEAELGELEVLVKQARTLARLEDDRKLKELLSVLEKLGDEKLLIFTEHKDTLRFLVEVLRKRGYAVTSIDGSMTLEERVMREREFRDSAQVMVATEAAGEGINLQFCAVMVNYDLPWNPTRLEQRMGRIHRYGQRYDVHIYNLVAEGTREGEVLKVVLDKLEVMRAQMGSDRVYDVVGELLSDVNLEALILEHLTGRKTLAEIRAVVEARLSPERVEFIREVTLEALAKRELDLSRLREERERSEHYRLQPEYTQRFFVRALTRLGGGVERRGDGLFRVTVPYDLTRRRPGVLAREYGKVTFDPKVRQEAELIAPGHPLFDLVLEETLAQAAPVLRQGAAFQTDQGTEGVLGYLEMSVVDGLGQTVSRRLYAAVAADTVQAVPAEFIVDTEPAPSHELPSVDAAAAKEKLLAWAYDQVLDSFFEEVVSERRREVHIRRKYARRSLEYLIEESVRKLTQYKLKSDEGEAMRLAILQEERKLKDLEERLKSLDDVLARAEALHPQPAEVFAQAYLRPRPLGVPSEDDPAVRKAVEEAAMRVSMAYEAAQGRQPRDVSLENLGYDIRSGDRHIEVKGRAGVGPVVLTPNEWISARRIGGQYWLYIVTEALTRPRLHLIQDPAAKLTPGEEVSVVRYVLPLEEWQQHAEAAAK